MAATDPTPRYIANDLKPTSRTPSKQVHRALQDLVTRFPPGTDTCEGGFYSGTVSIAFLLMTIGQYYADISLSSPYEDEPRAPISAWLIAYLEVVNKRFRKLEPPDADHAGVGCSLLASLALTTAMTKNVETAKELCDEIGAVFDKDSPNEWLNGRAGALYFLRLARTSFARVEDPETGKVVPETAEERSARKLLNRTIEKVILGILDAPRPWKYHGKHYLGAVHGDAGIIAQVILTEPTILTDPKFFPPPATPNGEKLKVTDYRMKLEMDIGVLLSYQTDLGNWPSSTPSGRTDLVQFCHGAPGIVSCLQSIHGFFGYNTELQARMDAAIAKGQEFIAQQGLVKKEPSLCHGIAGNALTLHTEQFEHFLTYTTPEEIKRLKEEYGSEFEMSTGRHRSGLYTGAAGRVWAWVVADQQDAAERETDGHPERSLRWLERRFLGFNEL